MSRSENEIARDLRERAKKLLDEAQELQAQARRLMIAADALEGKTISGRVPEDVIAPQRRPTRIEEIQLLLKERGPLKPKDIMRLGGIPRGTLAFALKTKNGFKKTKDGRWSV